jgi:DNA repair exonuclease SbcCD ATPase subunit
MTKGREQLDSLHLELAGVQQAVQTNESKGWTFKRLVDLSTAAGFGESPGADVFESARKAVAAERRQTIEALERIDEEARATSVRVGEIGVRFAREEAPAPELLRLVSSLRQKAEEQRSALIELGKIIDVHRTSGDELKARLRATEDAAIRLRTAIAKETQNSETIASESKALDDAIAEIAGLRVKLQRIDNANAVIQELLSQHSERALANTVLRENADRIAATFAKIHAPNEFQLTTENGLKIMRRGGGPVELEEMSSGQRAAYALSLFLAMNERLRAGPRVILFDDPVAHVDDINTLSLLDHLRDIALTGQRQIFFATADSKIGGLFARKFRFLGDEFKQIELTRLGAA